MKKRKIVDSFIFFNELDLLEYRLELLYDKVDHFILVESNKTHSGEDKPLYFTIHKKRFQKYLDKIVHIIVTDFPRDLTQNEIDKLVDIPEIRNMNWVREHHQRRAISRGLDKLDLDYEDVIFVSDVDEVPDIDKIDDVIQLLPFGPVVCVQRWFIWNTKWVKDMDWVGSTAFQYSHYIENKDIFQHLRNIRWDSPSTKFSTAICGWHFSWFGTLEFIKSKLNSFAHTELVSDYFTYDKNIYRLIKEGLPPETPTSDTIKLVPVEGGYLPPMEEKLNLFDLESFPKRYDCILMNDEIELVQLRIEESHTFIDYFVIVEARYTHTGEYKEELTFDKYKDRFAKYDEQIIYTVIEEFPEPPEEGDPVFFRETFQRNSIKDVLEYLEIRDQDYVFISNVDELYDSSTIDSTLKEYDHIEYDFLTIRHRWLYWDFEHQNSNVQWFGTQLIRWDNLKDITIQSIRDKKDYTDHVMKNYRGWHLSWFGSEEQRSSKLRNSAGYYWKEEIQNIDFNSLIENNLSIFNETLEDELTWTYYPKNKLLLQDVLYTSQEQSQNDLFLDLN